MLAREQIEQAGTGMGGSLGSPRRFEGGNLALDICTAIATSTLSRFWLAMHFLKEASAINPTGLRLPAGLGIVFRATKTPNVHYAHEALLLAICATFLGQSRTAELP
ncbi:MAG: hypothetical protein JO356_11680 [Acidobacteria bacterium]|nr:hypothetical protein [Acidobacteriota bacterium]